MQTANTTWQYPECFDKQRKTEGSYSKKCILEKISPSPLNLSQVVRLEVTSGRHTGCQEVRIISVRLSPGPGFTLTRGHVTKSQLNKSERQQGWLGTGNERKPGGSKKKLLRKNATENNTKITSRKTQGSHTKQMAIWHDFQQLMKR